MPKNCLDKRYHHKGRLLIVECKTGRISFRRQGLDILSSTAYLLGGYSVIKVYITDRSKMEHEVMRMLNEQAEKLGIVMFTAEDLPTIGKLLEEQAKTPKYANI